MTPTQCRRRESRGKRRAEPRETAPVRKLLGFGTRKMKTGKKGKEKTWPLRSWVWLGRKLIADMQEGCLGRVRGGRGQDGVQPGAATRRPNRCR